MRRHALGNDDDTTTNLAYSAQYISLKHLDDTALKYLIEEMKLTAGVDFTIPSPTIIQEKEVGYSCVKGTAKEVEKWVGEDCIYIYGVMNKMS